MSNLNEEDIAIIQERELNKQEEKNEDIAIDAFVIDNIIEWSNLITELSLKEVDLLKIKNRIFDKEQWMTENTDFKTMYGKNNADVRKQHFNKFLKSEYAVKMHLEISIDYLKRRISFLKQLIHTKTIIMEVKEWVNPVVIASIVMMMKFVLCLMN